MAETTTIETPVLEVSGLGNSFGNLRVLDDVTLTVAREGFRSSYRGR